MPGLSPATAGGGVHNGRRATRVLDPDWGAMTGRDDATPADGPPPTDLVRTFSALQSVLLTAQGFDDFLGEVTKVAAAVADPPASCGVTIRRGGQPLTVASSDERAEKIDEAQYESGQGPCLETLDTGAVQDVPDLSAETRWPDYRRQALDLGVRSSLSIPLSSGEDSLGGLNLYGYRPNAFAGAVRQHAEIFAAQATTALLLVLRNADQARQSDQLEQALSSRTAVDQALGILMAQQQCTADEAFALLRAHSQNN